MVAFRWQAIITVSVQNGLFAIASGHYGPFLIDSGQNGLFETVQFGRFSIASRRDGLFETGQFGRAAIVSGQNGTF